MLSPSNEAPSTWLGDLGLAAGSPVPQTRNRNEQGAFLVEGQKGRWANAELGPDSLNCIYNLYGGVDQVPQTDL